MLAIGNNAQFFKLLSALNLRELYEFKTNTLRLKNRVELLAYLEPEIAKINSEDFAARCNKNGVPIGEIKNLQEVFETEKAQNLVIKEIQEGEETKKVKTAVFQITF